MGTWIKNLLWLGLVAGTVWLWWAGEFASEKVESKIDPVRLSLQQATLYQYDSTGKQVSYLNSAVLQRLKNGETHYFSLRLWQKIPHGERLLMAGTGKQQNEKIFLENQVLAKEFQHHQLTMTLITEHLTYDRQINIAYTDAGLSLITPEGENYADEVEWKINQKLFILKKNIRSVYVPTS